MAHHVRAVRNGVARTHVCADLPAGTYRDPARGRRASARVLVEAGAGLVKLEGGLIDAVRAIVADGIPVMGHVGLLPQTAGSYRRQGTTPDEAERIVADARALDAAGCYAIVIEAVPAALAERSPPRSAARRSASPPGRSATARCCLHRPPRAAPTRRASSRRGPTCTASWSAAGGRSPPRCARPPTGARGRLSRRMTDEERRAFLMHGTRTGKLATVRADGRPHVAPSGSSSTATTSSSSPARPP